jgi:hypothetical protein
MTTTLANARIELSRQMGDYWASTTTATGTTKMLVDSALKAKQNGWIQDEVYDLLTSGTYSGESRLISSLSNTVGALTTLDHGGVIASGVTYEIHRLFTPASKVEALVWAARNIYPSCFTRVQDDSKTYGNWLGDGSFEDWTSSSALAHWTTTTSTIAQTTTSGLTKHSLTSCKLSGSAGYIAQSITNWADLQKLAGKSVTFTLQGWCDTASCLRLGIYDGVSYTYSEYHPGDSTWTTNGTPLTVSTTIDINPTVVTFFIYQDVGAVNSYVDDARVQGPANNKVYIGDLNLLNNAPYKISVSDFNYDTESSWMLLHNYNVDKKNGWIEFYEQPLFGQTLRIEGIQLLDFTLSGASSTAWTATINIDQPQLDILIAMAAYRLCMTRIMPTDTVGETKRWQDSAQYWMGEYQRRRSLFGMTSPGATVNWGV